MNFKVYHMVVERVPVYEIHTNTFSKPLSVKLSGSISFFYWHVIGRAAGG